MMVIQEIQRFPNHIDTSAIYESMNGRIDKGWRVHSCLVRGAEVIVVYERNEEVQDSITCLEKAYDELKEALKKKDDELKAVRHYFNECLKDLKKAHAEIDELTEKLECLLCHATGSKLSKSTYSLRTMESAVNDEVQECCEEARAEAIKEFNARVYAYKTGIYINGEELIIIPVSNYNEILKELEGDAE